ncbi:MAG: cupin domain-containing protein [Pseudomonadales bacterium]|nr:cupin domain-containing protein [Pseudomonadales bacterium]
MLINADFSQRVHINTAAAPWVPSPMAGVERKMLDRIGAESGHATSIVRYQPGSYFSPHTHDGGEEFLVLEGVFSDEHGDYPAGTYVRNPIGTTHKPYSDPGCTIFVKLWQFSQDDRRQFSVDTLTSPVSPLHQHGPETVRLLDLEADEKVTFPQALRQYEILMLSGTLTDGTTRLQASSWLRSPAKEELLLHAVTHTRCLIKTFDLDA